MTMVLMILVQCDHSSHLSCECRCDGASWTGSTEKIVQQCDAVGEAQGYTEEWRNFVEEKL